MTGGLPHRLVQHAASLCGSGSISAAIVGGNLQINGPADGSEIVVTNTGNMDLTISDNPVVSGDVNGDRVSANSTTIALDVVDGVPASADNQDLDVFLGQAAVQPASSGYGGAIGADTMTGGTGGDLFIIQTADLEGIVSPVDAQAAADVITDFVIADGDTIDFVGGAAPAANEYVEGPVGGFGNFLGAWEQANQDFTDSLGVVNYSAQQVGADVYIFADLDGTIGADAAVKLTGVTLADLTDTGAYIV